MNYPKFIDDSDFYERTSTDSELKQLKQLSNNLKRIHVLTTSHYNNFDELILAYLKEGLEIFGMDYGIVSNIKENEYKICNASSPDGSLKKGDIFELEGTYCREVYKTNEVLGFPHVGSMDELKGHPVYVNMKLESYLSAPIFVEDEIFGTLNFSSTKIREVGFSEYERDFISLMANSIGNFLFLQAKEEALKSSNDRLKRLVGYVAHDLRSSLGNISSIASILGELDEYEKEEFTKMLIKSADTSLEMVYTILEGAAMGSGKIDLNLEKTSLEEIVNQSLKSLRKNLTARGLNTIITIDPDTIVTCDENRLGQVFNNIISNVSKYAKESTDVTVELKSSSNDVHVTIKNQIDENTDKKFNLKSSVGFGEEIIREILSLHKANLKIEEKDNCYTYSFKISK